MQYLLHAKIKKPRELSNDEFFGVWQRESVAGRAIEAQGVPIFKVAGKYEVIVIVDVDGPGELDEAIHGLPIWAEGYQDMVDIDAIPLGSYGEWGEQLDRLTGQ